MSTPAPKDNAPSGLDANPGTAPGLSNAGLDKGTLLRFLNEQVLREQEIYWQRFYAFATLHAGWFVVLASDFARPNREWVARLGFLLGLIWVYAQWASLHYANRWKPSYHALLRDLNIQYEAHGLFASLFSSSRWASSTNAGLATAVLLCAVWGWLAWR